MKPIDKTGTRKKPTKLKMLQGTYRKDRANKLEPNPTPEIPSPPDHLSSVALIEWGRITNELNKIGLISQIDKATIAAYCQAYSDWAEASEACNRDGLTIETTNGNIIQNPAWGAKNKARDAMVKYAIEFGMTPSSRSKVSAAESEKPKNKWAIKEAL